MARDCRKKRTESTPALKEKQPTGKQSDGKPYQLDGKPGARTIRSSNLDPTSFLYSSDDDDDDGTDEAQVASAPKKRARMVHIEDKGSQPRRVTVNVQGVPEKGIIDRGADITIIVFKKVTTVSRLKRKPSKLQTRPLLGMTTDHLNLIAALT